GRTVALAAASDGRRAIYFIDTSDGRITQLRTDYWGLEVMWRPPDGRELMFIGGAGSRIALFRYSLDDGTVTEVPGTAVVVSSADVDGIRPVGWTPDGRR